MKDYLKKILEWKLRVLAKAVLRTYKPNVIGITGSVGKTSTKEAIFTVLSSKYRVWKNIKNYNNEIGVPLSIIGMESGNKNPFSWMRVFMKGISMILFRMKNYPEIIVLEMGADKPGDIKYLTDLAPCHIGVITAIGHVHTELLGSLEKIISEKQRIISHLKSDGIAVLNIDDNDVAKTAEKTRAQIVTFGYSEKADVRATELDISAGPSSDPWIDVEVKGLSFKLQFKGSTVPVFLPAVVGEHQVYAALAAAAIGLSLGMNMADISAALNTYRPPAGRMRLLPGIKHTSIIDDTYNSSPMASRAALKLLKSITVSGRKFTALGDMLELGTYTEQGHREVGMAAAEVVDVLITVGERAKDIANGALESGMAKEHVYQFGNTEAAGKFIQQRIKKGDIILIKGSQGARMERVVKELMAEPLKAPELLVRQSEDWLL